MSATKRIARNFSWLIVGNTISGIINFLAAVYIARTLQAAAFGMLAFVQAFLVYLVLIVDSGFSLFGSREIAKNRENAAKISINILALRVVISALLYLLCSLILFVFPIDSSMRLLFLLVFLLIFYRALNIDWIFQGLERMEYIAVAKLIVSVFSFVMIVAAIKIPADIYRVPLLQLIAGMTVSLAMIFFLYRKVIKFDLNQLTVNQWPNYFILALPLGASILMIQIYNNLDIIMLGILKNPTDVAYYSIAYQVFYVFFGAFYLWLSTAMPIMSHRINVDINAAERFISKFTKISLMIFIPAIICVCIAADQIVGIIFGPAYLPAAFPLRILIWNLVIIVIGSIYGALILIPAGKFKEYFRSAMVGAIVNIPMNLILIPVYGVKGAAIATLLSEGAALVIAYNYKRNIIKTETLKYFYKPILVSLISAAGYIVVMNGALFMPPVLRVLTSLSVFIVLYLLIMLIKEREFIVDFIREVF